MLELEGIIASEPTAEPIKKCEHGVYLLQGETTARYCGVCNPQTYHDNILLRTMARRKAVLNRKGYPEPRTLDTATFMEQNPGARLAGAQEFFE
jgi:hypothetical protein